MEDKVKETEEPAVEELNLPSNVNIWNECLKKLENEKQHGLIQDETQTIIVFGTKFGVIKTVKPSSLYFLLHE